jgi:hypothetical protein
LSPPKDSPTSQPGPVGFTGSSVPTAGQQPQQSFLEVVQARVKAHADGIRDLAAAGDEVFGRLLRQGVADDLDKAIAELTSFPR